MVGTVKPKAVLRIYYLSYYLCKTLKADLTAIRGLEVYMLDEKAIAKLEEMGFNRWTKDEKDRLYINPKRTGIIEEKRYSNTIDCFVKDRMIARRSRDGILGLKLWIDVNDGSIHIKENGFISGPNRWAIQELKEFVEEALKIATEETGSVH